MLPGFSCCEEVTGRGWKLIPGLGCIRCSYSSGQHVYAKVAGPVSLPVLPCDTDVVFDVPIFDMPVDLLLQYL